MKKYLLYGVLFWVVIFVLVTLIGFTPGLGVMGANGFSFTPLGTAAQLIVTVLLSLVFAHAFFKKSKNRGAVSGLKLGLAVLVIGTILDLVITVPLFVKSYAAYYSSWSLWVSFALSVTTFTLYTAIASNKKPL